MAKFRMGKRDDGYVSTIACIDIGFAHSGVVYMDVVEKGFQLVDKVVITTKKEVKARHIRSADDNIRRCKEIFEPLAAGIVEHDCRAVAIEMPSGGARSAIAMRAMGLASGVVAGLDCHFPGKAFIYVTPAEVKIALSGDKQASKEKMQSIAVGLYPELFTGVNKTNMEHLADAVGVSEVVKEDPIIQMLRSFKADDS